MTEINLKTLDVPKLVENSMGTPLMGIVQLLILMAKHSTDCVFMPVDIDSYTMPSMFQTFGDYELSWDADMEKLVPPIALGPQKWRDMLRECTDKSTRFVLMPLDMVYYQETQEGLKRKGHLNVLIYDKTTHTLERFEPNGQQSPAKYKTHILDKKLPVWFKFIFQTDITYITPVEFCPPHGFQYIEHLTRKQYNNPMTKGTCSLWSIIYADTRLTYPNKNRDEIYKLISTKIKLNNSDLYQFIVNYLNTVASIKSRIFSANSDEEIRNIILELVKKEKRTLRRNRSRQRKAHTK